MTPTDSRVLYLNDIVDGSSNGDFFVQFFHRIQLTVVTGISPENWPKMMGTCLPTEHSWDDIK